MKEIQVFVPTTISVSLIADTSAWLCKVQTVIARLFGGFTVFETIGGYVANNGELVEEKIFVVTTFCDETKFNRYGGIVRGLCRNMARALGQESVMFRVLDVASVEFIQQTR